MSSSVFVRVEFFALVIASCLLPVSLYAVLMVKRRISRMTPLVFGLVLVVLAGVDLVLIQRLAILARSTPSLLDDSIFNSELTLALYLLPAVSASLGANLISHVLITRLKDAEHVFAREGQRIHQP